MTCATLPRKEWVPDYDWTVLPATTTKTCRFANSAPYRRCQELAVAALYRRSKRRSYSAWWPYCGKHLYGRRIANGRVEVERIVREA